MIVCGYAAIGSNAQLLAWIDSQLCAGADHVVLRDARKLTADESGIWRWALEPMLHAGNVSLHGASSDECQLYEGEHGAWAGVFPNVSPNQTAWALVSSGSAWPRGLPASGQAEANAFWSQCLHAHASADWVVRLHAPRESMVVPSGSLGTARSHLDARIGGLVYGDDDADEEQSLVAMSAVHLPLVSYAESMDGSTGGLPEDMPQRPMASAHTFRRSTYGACRLADGEGPLPHLCLEGSHMVLAVRPSIVLSESSVAKGAVVLEPSTNDFHVADLSAPGLWPHDAATLPRGPHDVRDLSASAFVQACGERRASVTPPKPEGQPVSAADDWVDEVVDHLGPGPGLVRMAGIAEPTFLREIRRSWLRYVAPEKLFGRARIFTNHMCQIVPGVADTAGAHPACIVAHPGLWDLARDKHVLAVARRHLGADCILHNAGVALVGSGFVGPLKPHQDQPIPTGSLDVWAGRTIQPSHPLSLQAIWPMDDFDLHNGATFVLPRTHHRKERLDAWLDNGTNPAAAGLFPVAFATARVGDVLFLEGSAWHGASTYMRSMDGREAPRTALLFEYAPSFVSPKHVYRGELLAAHVPKEDLALFPRAQTLPQPAVTPTVGVCEQLRAAMSVHRWAAAVRERPDCVAPTSRVLLRDGRGAMPVFGLGTGEPSDNPAVIAQAIQAGYRLVDTGQLYGNEHIVRRAVELSGIAREDLFISSKAGEWCPGYYPTPRGTMARGVCIGGYQATKEAVARSLQLLNTHYIDLYLLHWPMSMHARREGTHVHAGVALHDESHARDRLASYRALVDLQRAGVLRAIGVANWSERQIREVAEATGEIPAVLQMELHPLLQRPGLRAFCAQAGIVVQVRCAERRVQRACC